jgi:hypothetical protein
MRDVHHGAPVDLHIRVEPLMFTITWQFDPIWQAPLEHGQLLVLGRQHSLNILECWLKDSG